MPPKVRSRHSFASGLVDAAGRTYLTDRQPFRFRSLAYNELHVVREGETLQSIAAQHYAPADRAAGLWWVVADFQPTPIHDPTLKLEVGRTLIVPSARTVFEELFSERRRRET